MYLKTDYFFLRGRPRGFAVVFTAALLLRGRPTPLREVDILRLAVDLRFVVLSLAVLRLAVLRLAVLRLAVLRFTVLCFAVLRFTILRLAVVLRLVVLRRAVDFLAVVALRRRVRRFVVVALAFDLELPLFAVFLFTGILNSP